MAGCPPAAKLAVLGDLIIPIVLAAFLCNRDVITLVMCTAHCAGSELLTLATTMMSVNRNMVSS